MIKKIMLILVVVFLLNISIVFSFGYGVSSPKPKLQLESGESGRFQFTIMNSQNDYDLDCDIILDNLESGLEVEMDIYEDIINSGGRTHFFGTVRVPGNLDVGTYKETFCISCGRVDSGVIGTGTGASVAGKSCDLPIHVEVVGERTRENLYVPPKPSPAGAQYNVVAVILILILVIIAVMFYALKKQPVKKSIKKK